MTGGDASPEPSAELGNDEASVRAARRAIKSGDFDTAEAIAANMLAEHPANTDALEIKALAEAERGDFLGAETSLRSAIALAPDRRWPYADLTRLLLRQGRSVEAEQVSRAAIAQDERNADAHAMLASMLSEQERWIDAAAHFERAITLVGNHPQLVTGLGQARMRSGRVDDAVGLLEAATKADPGALEPAVYLAEAYERLGKFEVAAKQLDVAEEIARKQGTDVDLQRSVLLTRIGQPERALELLERRKDLSGAARLQRGRLYDRLGRYSDAWDDWVAGKAQLAERSGRQYRAKEVAQQAKKLVEFASPVGQLPRADRREGIPQPIFIVGFPRSGTTLVEQILASHGSIIAGGELPFGAELHALIDSSAEALRDHYLARAGQYGLLDTRSRYFTDKMPDNAFWLPLVRMAFPESPAIYLRRHSLDIMTSVMAYDMTHGFNCGYRLEDAARHLALVDDLLETCDQSGVGPTYELRYEALVADQAGETERLMAAIGLPMESGQLRFHERAGVSPTPSYAQVREPLNERSIGRWRHYATELQPVIPLLAAAMERGGYTG